VRKLNEVGRAFLQADAYFGEKGSAARSPAGEAKWAMLRHVNAQAYLVMMFACLEDRVNGLCARLVARKRSQASWRQRRPWDTVDLERTDFMRKVALLADKGSADYARVKGLYETRCQISHGDFRPTGSIDLPASYAEIQRLWKALRP
jgi:hypothetical protein